MQLFLCKFKVEMVIHHLSLRHRTLTRDLISNLFSSLLLCLPQFSHQTLFLKFESLQLIYNFDELPELANLLRFWQFLSDAITRNFIVCEIRKETKLMTFWHLTT